MGSRIWVTQLRCNAEHREPYTGLVRFSGLNRFSTMPATAWAALPITLREIAFTPANRRAYIMVISVGPTKGAITRRKRRNHEFWNTDRQDTASP